MIGNKHQGFEALFNNSAIGIITVNAAAEIVLINEFAMKQFGYTTDELIGRKIEVLIPQRYNEKHVKYRSDFQRSEAHSRPMGSGLDLFAIRKDGTEFPVEVSLSTYKIDSHQYAVAFVSDITVRKRSEEALKKLNVELEQIVEERTLSLHKTVERLNEQIREAEEKDMQLRKSLEKEKELNELKSRFVSMASHEFRTPLSTISSSAYLVTKYETTEDHPKRDRHVQRIISSVNMLTDILNDFLSVGKIEEGKIQVRLSDFDIREPINNMVNEMNTILKKGQEIIYTHTGETIVYLDLSLLKHIVMNLLSNAIKFSPENSILIISTWVTDDSVELRVKDSGLGISKEDQEHLFERFFRGNNVTNIQGTGLGLHIVSKYVEMMNGTMTCDSELNKGTEFIINFRTQKNTTNENNFAD